MRTWVSLKGDEAAVARVAARIEALTPAERLRRLLGPAGSLRATTPAGGWLRFEWGDGEIAVRRPENRLLTPAQEAVIGAALAALCPDAAGDVALDRIIGLLQAAGFEVQDIIL